TSWPVRRLGVLLRPPPHAGWRRFGTQAASLLGVAGVAICQPVLDLFGRNPTFFVAGRYSAGQIVAFALVVALPPAAVAVAPVRRRRRRRAGQVGARPGGGGGLRGAARAARRDVRARGGPGGGRTGAGPRGPARRCDRARGGGRRPVPGAGAPVPHLPRRREP